MKNWVNLCRYQFSSDAHIIIKEFLYLIVTEIFKLDKGKLRYLGFKI